MPAQTCHERAVEVAARAWFDRQQSIRRDSDRLRPDGSLWQWEDHRPEDQRAYRALVEPIVTALAAADLLHTPRNGDNR